jgi:hypothetical protein
MNLLPTLMLLVSQILVTGATVYFLVKVLKSPLKDEGE